MTQNLGYIGSKSKLSTSILENIKKFINEPLNDKIIGDLFAGAGSMSRIFKDNYMNVIANDSELYSFYILSAHLNSNYTDKINNLITQINSNIENIKFEDNYDGLIFQNYSEKGINQRMFFTPINAGKIDYCRKYIQNELDITQNEFNFLIASLIVSADKIANTASVYGAYLKKYKVSASKSFSLIPIHTNNNETLNTHTIYKDDIMNIYNENSYDIVYLDPPYNSRQYSKNYHVLNYIAEYNDKITPYGVTGLFKDCFISDFCKKSEIENLFDKLFKELKTKYIFLSYNSESLLSKEKIENIIKKYCNRYETIETDYNRFKSNSNKKTEKQIVEYLFCCEKK
jgi:adenine-specific DNA-methyltransferase